MRNNQSKTTLRTNNHNIYIVKIARTSPRPAGRPRKLPSARKKTISVTLNPATIKKMEAVRQVHIENRFPPPGDSWMVEQGLDQYFQFESTRFAQLRALFAGIEQPLPVVGSIQGGSAKSTSALDGNSPSGKGKGS